MTQDRRDEQIQQLTSAFQCEAQDLAGETLRQLFEAADQLAGVAVYWGFWTDAELDVVLVPLDAAGE